MAAKRTWNPWAGLGGLPRGVWVLCAATLVNRCGMMVMPFLALYCTQALGFEASEAGLALTCYGIGSLVIQPLAGRLSDRVGPTRVMLTSLLLSSGAILLFPLARSPVAVYAAALLLGLVADAFRPANMAVLNDLVGDAQRKPAIALHRLALNLGYAVGPAFGGLLARWSYHALFVVNALGALLTAAVLLRFPLGNVVHVAAAAAPRVRAVWREPRFAWFLLTCTMAAIVFFQSAGALPLYLKQDLGLEETDYGLVFTINTLLIVLCEVRIVLAIARWPTARVLVLGSIVLAVGFGMLAFCRDRPSVFASVVVWTVAEMAIIPAMANHVGVIAPPGQRGEYMGLWTMAWGVAFAIGPWAGATALGSLGPVPTWLGAGAVGLLAAAMFARVRT